MTKYGNINCFHCKQLSEVKKVDFTKRIMSIKHVYIKGSLQLQIVNINLFLRPIL